MGGDSPITAKLTAAEATARCVLLLLAPHEYCPVPEPKPSSWIFFRVRVEPEFSISCWLRNHWKVAAGLETAEHVRLKSEPSLMKGGGVGGVRATSSGPSGEERRTGEAALHLWSVLIQHWGNQLGRVCVAAEYTHTHTRAALRGGAV